MISAKLESTNSTLLSLSLSQNSISGGANLVLIGTKTAPAQDVAYNISKYLSLLWAKIAILSSVLILSFLII